MNEDLMNDKINVSEDEQSSGFSHEPVKKNYSPPPAPPVRRVGTLTMGFALIAAGAAALVHTFVPSFDLFTVLRLWPVIFIFLGIEVLSAHFFHKNERIKYDFFSGLVCFMLVCGCALLSLIPIGWQYFGPRAAQIRDQLNTTAQEEIYQLLHEAVDVDYSHVRVDLPYYVEVNQDADFRELSKQARLYASIGLTGPYKDEKAFAKDCRIILDRLQSSTYTGQDIYIRYEGKDISMSLSNSGDPFRRGMDAERLASEVDVTRYDRDGDEYSDEDYDDGESVPEDEESAADASEGQKSTAASSEVAAASEEMVSGEIGDASVSE